jgi:hypothetical protein
MLFFPAWRGGGTRALPSVKTFVCFVCFVVASGVIVPRSAFRIPRLNVLFLGFLP